MVAIVNRRPMTLGILPILDAYIAHQKEVVTRRTKFDLDFAEARMHIVEGLIKALSILDEVIKTIRASKNKADARVNLMEKFGFTEKQAEAILVLQLYRLTNMDIEELKREFEQLNIVINGLKAILADEDKLKDVMKDELRKVKKEYATPRKTEVKDEITEIKIDTTEMISKEDCIVVVTSGDYVINLSQMNTLNTMLLFTNKGNYLYVPVHELPEQKWKELGKHISNIIKIDEDEKVIECIPVYDFETNEYITMFTKNGMVKRTKLSEFKVQRYTKPITCMKLKDDDEVVTVTNNSGSEVFVTTKNGYGLRYKVEEISEVGLRAAGVKAISLKNDIVICAHVFENMDYLSVITDKGTAKRIKLLEFEPLQRARKGILMVRDVKTNPYSIIKTFIIPAKESIMLKLGLDYKEVKLTELPITDRYSTGTVITKSNIEDIFETTKLMKESSKDEVAEEPTILEKESREELLNKVDEKILTIDDFLDDFKFKD